MDNVHFMSEKNNWETPQELFDALHAEFGFTLDAAASDDNHKLPRYYTAETNGLVQDWGGNECSVTLPMEVRIPGFGLRSAGKKLKSRTPWLCFLSRREQIEHPSMTSSTISPMWKSVSCEVGCALKIMVKSWIVRRFPPCSAFSGV